VSGEKIGGGCVGKTNKRGNSGKKKGELTIQRGSFKQKSYERMGKRDLWGAENKKVGAYSSNKKGKKSLGKNTLWFEGTR